MTCSLYIHLPFCARKCHYCDFYSTAGASPQEIDTYLDWLRGEITRQITLWQVEYIPSLYIGGGTPSILGAARLEKFLAFLKKTLPGAPPEAARTTGGGAEEPVPRTVPEWTVEVNLESVSGDLIKTCLDGGITRLSAGIQTFNDTSRKAIGRAGSAKAVIEKLELLARVSGKRARQTPFDLSFDLMSGLPFQDEDDLISGIARALSYQPSHLSLYDLALEEGTALAQKAAAKEIPLPCPETAAALWIAGRDTLEQAGFPQYEISNFAPRNKRSLHNIRYWRMQNWLGCGASASGTIIDDKRRAGIRLTDGREEHLDTLTLIQETLMMGFRFIEGPSESLFEKRFGAAIEHYIPQTLSSWKSRNLLQKNRLALTKDGLLLLNRFIADCFLELETTAPNKDC